MNRGAAAPILVSAGWKATDILRLRVQLAPEQQQNRRAAEDLTEKRVKRKAREICKVRNSILCGFSKQKQSLHYFPFSLTTRCRFIPAALGVKTPAVAVQKLPLQLFLLGLIRANTGPLPRAPASPSSGLTIKQLHGNLAIQRKSSH